MMSRVVIVTDASRGIGAATARLAGRRGYDVCINYRQSRDAAEAVAADVRAAGQRAITVAGDIGHEADILALFEATDTEFGRLDALVNNAGIITRAGRVEDVEADALRRMFDINVVGCFLCAREAVRRLSTRHGGEGGAIVNLSSRAAGLGSPNEYVDYAASKGAIDSFTLGLAKEVAAEGIRVNAVSPGLIETDIHDSAGLPGRLERLAPLVPMQRPGSAEETAETILWLLSDAASYVTAANIHVAGGR
ncbi:MAG: SDR family oxidoreductase [Alphaproteobacteria bacterium]|nr:SDR family oxidoreductase [Alphaproteobacteria bacterium]